MCTLLTQNTSLVCHTQVLELRLYNNHIGDAGLTALAQAVESGALASLKTLVLDNEEHPALKAACQARGIDLR